MRWMALSILRESITFALIFSCIKLLLLRKKLYFSFRLEGKSDAFFKKMLYIWKKVKDKTKTGKTSKTIITFYIILI